ncbi:hypothetical protein HMI54_009815 [Coelomomyces lativittatus]|nr:hypothetical protein HMI56_001468 [Coelomomyces lativittatus]KAJ1516347.1 hypothetical protein HMI54_009815 [Coelomomyces lativittatus]
MSLLKTLKSPSENVFMFQVTRSTHWDEEDDPIISEDCVKSSIKFRLQARFTKSNIFLTLSVSEFKRTNIIYQGSLIELTVACIYNNMITDQSKNLILRICLPNVSWDIGEFKTFSRISSSQFQIRLTFEFMYPFNLDSCLVFSFSTPSKTPLFRYLNNKEASDCCFQLNMENQELWVRKDIITFECPFFEKMLLGEWSKKLEDKINVPWSDKVLLSCILHLYTGWLPGSPICEEVFKKLNLNGSALKLDVVDLSELHVVAKMLELHTLSYFSLAQLRKIAETQQALLRKNLFTIPLEIKN